MQVKRLYNRGGPGRLCAIGLFLPYFAVRTLAKSVVTRENAFANYDKVRGMSIVHDWLDWLGGYPYEVATADQIVTFCQERGFILVRQRVTASLGNNEFVFSAGARRARERDGKGRA